MCVGSAASVFGTAAACASTRSLTIESDTSLLIEPQERSSAVLCDVFGVSVSQLKSVKVG